RGADCDQSVDARLGLAAGADGLARIILASTFCVRILPCRAALRTVAAAIFPVIADIPVVERLPHRTPPPFANRKLLCDVPSARLVLWHIRSPKENGIAGAGTLISRRPHVLSSGLRLRVAGAV